MVRITPEVIDILEDLGKCGLMNYTQIQRLHFKTYDLARQKISKLVREGYIHGTPFFTQEKIFSLTKEGVSLLNDQTGEEYKEENYKQIEHKLRRTDLYVDVKPYNITDWKSEALYQEYKVTFDAKFRYNDKMYVVEVHNKQKTKELKDKLIKFTGIKGNFNVIVYCKNKNIVNKMVNKLLEDDKFKRSKRYGFKIYQFGESVKL